nr:hypothetical protein [Tanacetum cinerariifolium]
PGVKFCAGEGGSRSWEWCGGGGVEGKTGESGVKGMAGKTVLRCYSTYLNGGRWLLLQSTVPRPSRGETEPTSNSPQPKPGHPTTTKTPDRSRDTRPQPIHPSQDSLDNPDHIMVIDKSWTYLERSDKAFYTGLKKFVEHFKPLVNIIHNTTQPQMSDMISCLNDLSYIPLNNEQNEPTQKDIDKTSNELTQAIRNEFDELYLSANEEMYLGCDYVTRLDFMAKFTHFRVKGKLIDSIFNEMLEFFQFVFPPSKGYKLPPSYYVIKKTFKTIELGCESIHACVNDCFLFWGEDNKDKQLCPVCNTSRWKDNHTTRKKVPKKVLRYFLIIAILQRVYKSSHTVKEMTWNATGKCTELLCMKKSYLMLTLLIPGPKSPGKDNDIYLRHLIDDLKDLWTINDFSPQSSLSRWSGQGYMTCPTCNKDTPSMRVLSKTAYVGRISFLKKPHKWRRLCDFKCEIKDGDPPREFDRDEILTQLNRLPMRVKGKHLSYGGVKIKRNVLQYLPSIIAAPIIELCSFFKQICSQTLMEADMLKSQSKVVDIMCNLELIYSPSFFDIMIHMVIHLPLEALEGGPIHPRRPPGWKVVQDVSHKKFLTGTGGVIVVEDDDDVMHFDNSYDLALFTSLDDLDFSTMNIDGQSMDVDAPQDIINVDEDDDSIDDEDALPHDLADSYDEDLTMMM